MKRNGEDVAFFRSLFAVLIFSGRPALTIEQAYAEADKFDAVQRADLEKAEAEWRAESGR